MDTKSKIKTKYSITVIQYARSKKEIKILESANLQEMIIKQRICLVKQDIDWNEKDSKGRTMLERAQAGLAPLDKTGKPIELHHVGQDTNAPLAELTHQEHHGNNEEILHNRNKASNIKRNRFEREKKKHWKERAKAQVNMYCS